MNAAASQLHRRFLRAGLRHRVVLGSLFNWEPERPAPESIAHVIAHHHSKAVLEESVVNGFAG